MRHQLEFNDTVQEHANLKTFLWNQKASKLHVCSGVGSNFRALQVIHNDLAETSNHEVP